jgi:hypothetical protein
VVRLTIQEEKNPRKTTKNRYNNNKKFSLLSKSPGLTPLVSNLVLVLGYWALWGTVLPLLLDSLRGRCLEDFFSAFLGFMGHLLQVGALK